MRSILLFFALMAAIPAGEYGSGGLLLPELSDQSEGLTGALSLDNIGIEKRLRVSLRWDAKPLTWNWFWEKDTEDTYQQYGFSFLYVPFEGHGHTPAALLITPSYWTTTNAGVTATQFGTTIQYAIAPQDTALSIGLGYLQDDGESDPSQEIEPLASIARRLGKGWLRAEWRGGGNVFLARKTAFSYETVWGRNTFWAGWKRQTFPDGSSDDGITVGWGLLFPWPKPASK
ncbi:hypothetical protein H8D30_05555 [bacterium]|nr:hypothetical protein [bacterium]